MADLEQMSMDDKEEKINKLMEQIRKKNEELKKRHEEVQADKKNADLSSTGALTKKVMPPVPKVAAPESPIVVVPKVPRPLGRGRQLSQNAERMKSIKAPDLEHKHTYKTLNQGEGPPPDPSFNFLHDKLRERADLQDRHQGSRRHVSNYGGQDFENVKTAMQMRKNQDWGSHQHKPEISMTGKERVAYASWRQERAKIEEERLARQRTVTGEWRREWDKDKLVQEDEDDKDTSWKSRGMRGNDRGEGKRGGRWQQGNVNSSSQQNMEAGPNPLSRTMDAGGSGRIVHGISPVATPTSSDNPVSHSEDCFNIGASGKNPEDGKLDDKNVDTTASTSTHDRSVIIDEAQIKISIPNKLTEGVANPEEKQKETLPLQQPKEDDFKNYGLTFAKLSDNRLDCKKNLFGSALKVRGQRGRRGNLSSSSQSDDEWHGRETRQPIRRAKHGTKHIKSAHPSGFDQIDNKLHIATIDNNLESPDQNKKPVNLNDISFGSHASVVKDCNAPQSVLQDAAVNACDAEEGSDESWDDMSNSGNESVEFSSGQPTGGIRIYRNFTIDGRPPIPDQNKKTAIVNANKIKFASEAIGPKDNSSAQSIVRKCSNSVILDTLDLVEAGEDSWEDVSTSGNESIDAIDGIETAGNAEEKSQEKEVTIPAANYRGDEKEKDCVLK